VSAEHWRSLGELEESAESRAFREREFPEGASEAPEGVSRVELAREIFARFRSARTKRRDWRAELERDARDNEKVFGRR